MAEGCICFVRILKAAAWRCYVKKVVPERASFATKLQALSLKYFFKNRQRYGCFPVNFAKKLRIHFLMNTSARLIL